MKWNEHQFQKYVSSVKSGINQGLPIATAFFKTLEDEEFHQCSSEIYSLLARYAIPSVHADNDYWFIDGSYLNIDIESECMIVKRTRPDR